MPCPREHLEVPLVACRTIVVGVVDRIIIGQVAEVGHRTNFVERAAEVAEVGHRTIAAGAIRLKASVTDPYTVVVAFAAEVVRRQAAVGTGVKHMLTELVVANSTVFSMHLGWH